MVQKLSHSFSFFEKLWFIYSQRIHKKLVNKNANFYLKPNDIISYRPTLFGYHESVIETLIKKISADHPHFFLDLGANIECSSKNLVDFSIMGSALLKALFVKIDAKVALLNIGSEELKGNAMIKDTYQILNDKKYSLFDFHGYIEGNQIMDGKVNVIVTDGFTGNIALKTAEGTSNFIIGELKKALSSSIIGKLSSLLNFTNLKKFKNKLDPRLYNGAILLGLDKPVIKSHGSTDAIGFANSLKVCEMTIKGNLIEEIKRNIK